MFGFSLKAFGKKSRDSYLSAESFPHMVIDKFFSNSMLKKLMKEFNVMEHGKDFPSDQSSGKKMRCGEFSPLIESAFLAMERKSFLKFLEDLTGIRPLISDPSRYGAGLHSTERGGQLRRHLDFTKGVGAMSECWRRVNILVFMNQDWDEEWGGTCSLSTPKGKIITEVLPVANRAIIFNASSKSWHGQTEPINCPPDRHRMSIACYYYSDSKADEDQYYRCTLYED